MNVAAQLVHVLLETNWDKVDAKLAELNQQRADARLLLQRLSKSILGGKHSEQAKATVADLVQKAAEADRVADHLYYAVAYRKALQQHGLKPEDVAQMFGKENCLTHVRLKDGKEVRFLPPVYKSPLAAKHASRTGTGLWSKAPLTGVDQHR